ncbi:MAG: Ig-like domain-containing protein, partial [Dehalococcoidia bacterium]|nr:Ig-like domain-containing protein [Dehalococcoidia bacterium]
MSEQPAQNAFQRQIARLSGYLDTPVRKAAAALGAAVVVGAVAGLSWFALTREGEHTPYVEPPGFAVSPEGDDVPRLTPIKVTFAAAPDEREPQKLLQVEPAVPGSYAWLSDRTVLFQPEYPGLLRGSTYTVKVAARPETGLTGEVQRQFTVTGLLTVQQAIPGNGDTEVPLNAPVMIQFSRSVAPLTTLSAQSTAAVIEFDPPLEGTGEWLNTSIYRFVPANLQPYTTYKLRIPKGLTSAADGVLREDYAWSFTTVSPAVAKFTPDNNTDFASPRQQVAVTFNQPMDPAAASG